MEKFTLWRWRRSPFLKYFSYRQAKNLYERIEDMLERHRIQSERPYEYIEGVTITAIPPSMCAPPFMACTFHNCPKCGDEYKKLRAEMTISQQNGEHNG